MNEQLKYYWTGVNFPLMIFIGLLEFFCVFAMFISKSFVLYLVIGVFLFIILILFFSIKVTVDYDNLYLTYGIGLVEQVVPLTEIKMKRIVPNRENMISLIYNMSAVEALKLELRDGRDIYVPTDSCKQLQRAINILG